VHQGHIGVAAAAAKRSAWTRYYWCRRPAGVQNRSACFSAAPSPRHVAPGGERPARPESIRHRTGARGPSYTVDTVEALKKKYEEKAEIYFILGWDSLKELPAGTSVAPGDALPAGGGARPGTPRPM